MKWLMTPEVWAKMCETMRTVTYGDVPILDPTVAMMRPTVKRKFSEYLYTSAAKIAVLDSDVGQASEQATAKGAVDVFLSDFSILKLVPNRLQPLDEGVLRITSLADYDHWSTLDDEAYRLAKLRCQCRHPRHGMLQ